MLVNKKAAESLPRESVGSRLRIDWYGSVKRLLGAVACSVAENWILIAVKRLSNGRKLLRSGPSSSFPHASKRKSSGSKSSL